MKKLKSFISVIIILSAFALMLTACGGGGDGGGTTTPDTTPPTVSSTSPASNATGFAVNSAITATFSEAMNASTITTATFTLKAGASSVSGTVSYSGTTATFTPSLALSTSTTYTGTITTGVKDLAGNAMASNYSWSFTTGTAGGGGGTFKSTANTYSETNDINQKCISEFGSNYKLADWNDLVSYYQSGGSMTQFMSDVSLPDTDDGKSLMVSWNGARFYGNTVRQYFISRHDHVLPSYYLSHANIDNHLIDLGSWYGLNMRVLCLLNATTPDTTPPSVPTGLTATTISSSQIDLSWSASTDNVGVAGYKLYRGGVYRKSVTTTSTSDTGLSASTQYYYTVSAYDAAGNESAQSMEACATTLSGGAPSGVFEDFEDGALDSKITIETTGSFSSSPGIKNTTSFGSTKAYGFGRSTCGASCFQSYATNLVITFPSSTYVSGISFKEMEMYGNWGSSGLIYVDGVRLTNSLDFGRSPGNDLKADTTYRSQTFSINKYVTTIKLRVEDITNSSEILIDDIAVSFSE